MGELCHTSHSPIPHSPHSPFPFPLFPLSPIPPFPYSPCPMCPRTYNAGVTVTARINGERLAVLGWGRAILLQLAHPMVAAGVAEHSTFRSSPAARVRAAPRDHQGDAGADLRHARRTAGRDRSHQRHPRPRARRPDRRRRPIQRRHSLHRLRPGAPDLGGRHAARLDAARLRAVRRPAHRRRARGLHRRGRRRDCAPAHSAGRASPIRARRWRSTCRGCARMGRWRSRPPRESWRAKLCRRRMRG